MSFNKQAPVLNKKVYINNKREKSKLLQLIKNSQLIVNQ